VCVCVCVCVCQQKEGQCHGSEFRLFFFPAILSFHINRLSYQQMLDAWAAVRI
jgi:hypothetical protein